MNLKELYKSKLMSADEAVKMIQDGWSVAVPVAVGQPPVLINALARRKDEFTRVELFTVVDVYPTEMMTMDREDPFILDYSYCVVQRAGVQQGKYVYTPGRLGEVPRFPEYNRHYQAVMLQVAPMDKNGYFSMGLSCDYIMPLSRYAEKIIVQVNEKMPRTFGRNFLHISEIDAIVEATHPLPALPSPPPNEKQKIIGQYIADLIEDGSCLQLGIGGIPNAVAHALGNKKDLGLHTEMFGDGAMWLHEQGVITNRKKTYMPDISVATFALGSEALYEWLDNNVAVHFYPCDLVNDPFIIAQNDKLISINSAIEIDLSGQVCAESIGPKQYTHTGGQADFVLGSHRSRGGKTIIAFESVAETKDGLVSKIVTHLKYGSFVTAARYDTNYVVTEYGVAKLKGMNLWDRAKSLIAIAHPDFRDQLTFEAKKAYFI
ncbi:MAG TPA: acetyl-CoA hydrolase/transferase C-terminal domain-containing protein [Syntrophomonadaceae bacterium]|nr:acetyl-CoA hydrolase/transferase C-terminal domain-containing protein [Syntrophomonadaceae bacterium]HPU49083.1 acetyl-CoA hydrolase/transferase C-terminal domain-containing protein [Syntrophomonadaceae bacterium]